MAFFLREKPKAILTLVVIGLSVLVINVALFLGLVWAITKIVKSVM